MNLYSLICIEPNFVPKEIINTLLNKKSNESSPATVGVGDDSKVNDYRKTKWLTLPDDIFYNLKSSIHEIHESVFKPLYNSTLVNIEGPQFLRYDIEDHYDIHNDSEHFEYGKLVRSIDRDISILLYLNDDYEGGQLEFTQLHLTIKPKAGMLIAFPSYFDFEHKVHPVTKGTRYTIVSWIHTEKRIYERPYDTPRNLPRTWVLSD
jgi:Rps23 Pro-64 3,4-dihydroxylase Tpa1-like proline 4-hydroxylase